MEIVEWSKEDKLLINWFHFYVAARTVTRDMYDGWLSEIEKGPSSERAKSGELMKEIKTIKRLVESQGLLWK